LKQIIHNNDLKLHLKNAKDIIYALFKVEEKKKDNFLGFFLDRIEKCFDCLLKKYSQALKFQLYNSFFFLFLLFN
jgi:hypothetical protein